MARSQAKKKPQAPDVETTRRGPAITPDHVRPLGEGLPGYKTKTALVYSQLRRDILAVRYPPGTLLNEIYTAWRWPRPR